MSEQESVGDFLLEENFQGHYFQIDVPTLPCTPTLSG